MNQKVALVAGASVLLLFAIFIYCPWQKKLEIRQTTFRGANGVFYGPGLPIYQTETVYSWCWDPPKLRMYYEYGTVRLDLQRMTLQISVVMVVSGALMWVLHDPRLWVLQSRKNQKTNLTPEPVRVDA